MYENPKEVLSLARLRFDRTSGPGTFDESAATVFTPGVKESRNRGVATILDKMCREAIAAAERDIRDVVTSIPELAPTDGASDWLKALAAPAPSSEPGSLDFLNKAVAIFEERRTRGALGGWVILSSPNGLACGYGEVFLGASLADGVRKLERSIRMPGVEECAVAVALELLPDADIAAMRAIARLLGTETAPASLLLCMIAHRDGYRTSILHGDRQGMVRVFLPYCAEGPIEEAYAVIGAGGSSGDRHETPNERTSRELAEYALGHMITLAETWSEPRPAEIWNSGGEDNEYPLRGDERPKPGDVRPMTSREAIERVQRELSEEGTRGYAIATPFRPRPGNAAADRQAIQRMFPGPGIPDLIYIAVAGWNGGPLTILAQPSHDGMQRFNPTMAELERIARAYEPAVPVPY